MRICTNCGKAYSRDNTFCPYCGMTPYSTGRVCPRGHPNPRDAIFCATCGSPDLSEMAPPPPLWRRLVLLSAILGGIALAIWLLTSVAIPNTSRFLSAQYLRLKDTLMPVIVFILIIFGVTLFLPKHMGQYTRKVMFSLVRYSFRLIIRAVTVIWGSNILHDIVLCREAGQEDSLRDTCSEGRQGWVNKKVVGCEDATTNNTKNNKEITSWETKKVPDAGIIRLITRFHRLIDYTMHYTRLYTT